MHHFVSELCCFVSRGNFLETVCTICFDSIMTDCLILCTSKNCFVASCKLSVSGMIDKLGTYKSSDQS